MPPTRPDRRRRGRGDHGQATVEHAGIVLLVAAVLGAAVLVADRVSARVRIGESVQRQMARALCLVDGSSAACSADTTACVVGSHDTGFKGAIEIFAFQREEGRVLVKERRSDGTVAMTILDSHALGAGGGNGVEAHGRRGGQEKKDRERTGRDDVNQRGQRRPRDGRVSPGVAANVDILARLGMGTTWVFDNEAEADRWARKPGTLAGRVVGFGSSRLLAPGDPVSTMVKGSLDVNLHGAANASGLAEASLSIQAADTWGTSIARDGTRTVFLRRDQNFKGSLSGLGRDVLSADRAATDEYALKFDQSGRMLELIVTTIGNFSTSRDLPGTVQRAAGLLGGGGEDRRYVLERHLSLTSPQNSRLAASYVRRVMLPLPKLGRIVDVSPALRAVLDEEGTAQVRAYDQDDRSFGGSARFTGEVKGGVRGERIDVRSYLVSAAALGPDGAWYTRRDCVDAAAI